MHLGKARSVAQTEIEPLPGDRVQPLRGVADDRQARRGVPLGARQRQLVDTARPTRRNRPSRNPNAACSSARKCVVRQRDQPRGFVRRVGPDDAAASVCSGSIAIGPFGVKRS